MADKNILVFFTGGTICSEYTGNIKASSEKTGTVLEECFRKSDSEFACTAQLTFTRNYGIFSENMTVEKWNFILRELAILLAPNGSRGATENVHFDGLIIAHGTDSLGYSAAMLSILLKCPDMPVFLVSSNEALESPRANGNDNFRAAVDCICYGIDKGVYVTYRRISNENERQPVFLHYASKLTQCGIYRENFYSDGMTDISGLNGGNAYKLFERFKSNNRSVIQPAQINTISIFDGLELKNKVLKAEPYVGLDYGVFNLSGYRFVLHGAYHSGTVCSEKEEEYSRSSVRYLIDRCARENIPLFIAPAKGIGELYDTVPVITRHVKNNAPECRVRFAYGCTLEMYYAKLVVAASLGFSDLQTDEFLSHDYCHEFNSLASPAYTVFKCEE